MAVPVQVVGGVDPHADTIHVAVLTALGKVIGDAEFPTTADGYRRVVVFLTGSGDVERVGVEGAAGYGAGITRALAAAGTRGRRAILIMAPEPVRARFRALSTDRLVTAVLRCRGLRRPDHRRHPGCVEDLWRSATLSSADRSTP